MPLVQKRPEQTALPIGQDQCRSDKRRRLVGAASRRAVARHALSRPHALAARDRRRLDNGTIGRANLRPRTDRSGRRWRLTARCALAHGRDGLLRVHCRHHHRRHGRHHAPGHRHRPGERAAQKIDRLRRVSRQVGGRRLHADALGVARLSQRRKEGRVVELGPRQRKDAAGRVRHVQMPQMLSRLGPVTAPRSCLLVRRRIAWRVRRSRSHRITRTPLRWFDRSRAA